MSTTPTKKRVRRFCAVLIGLFALLTDASAYVGELSFLPSDPTPEDAVSLFVTWGECDAVLAFDAYDRAVQVNGSNVEVVVAGDLSPSAFCLYPPFNTTELILGTFPRGSYNVTLAVNDPINITQPVVYRHGTFTVSARSDPPRVIPATHRVVGGVLALVLACVGAAAIVLRQRSG